MAAIESKLLGNNDVKIKITYSSSPKPVIAAYDYYLKDSDANPPIEHHPGDNRNSQDDIYSLPTPVNINVARYILLKSQIAAIDAPCDYEIKVEVLQNGTVTDTLLSK